MDWFCRPWELIFGMRERKGKTETKLKNLKNVMLDQTPFRYDYKQRTSTRTDYIQTGLENST